MRSEQAKREDDAVTAERSRGARRRYGLAVFVALQVGVPLAALLIRLTTGELSSPWGWQMWSA